MRSHEFCAATGLDAPTVSRLVDRGVVQPEYPWGRGSGRPAFYSDVDVTAALVRLAVVVNNEAHVADAVAVASRTGAPYIVHARGAAIGCPTLVDAIGWLEDLGPAGVLTDVARVLEVAEPARIEATG